MDRRSFLKSTGVAATMAAGTVTATTAQEASPMAEPDIRLDLRGGDVWAWEKRITGVCAGFPLTATIDVLVNGEPVPAERNADAFAATVRLAPGPNDVMAAVTLSTGKTVVSDHVVLTVRLSPRPTARIEARVMGHTVTFDGKASEVSEFDGGRIRSWAWSERPDNPEPLLHTAGATPDSDIASLLRVTTPATSGEYYVSLEITDEKGRSDVATACLVVENGDPRIMDPITEEADWVERAVVYGMVVRNFTSEGFRGVTSRLHELEALGVTAVWFAPITRMPTDDFGYAVTDYFNVREEYGTLDDFRALVDAAHARGLRVLMDFVPNHTSIQHPYFLDADEYGEASQYYDFYDRDDGGNPTHYFQWSHLPNLNFDNPEVRRFMTEAFTFWARECDVDGFRVDVAWGIKERRPDYWLEWSAELNRIKPDSLLIAEASARDPFYVHNGFDAAYDWTDDLGVWAWADAFAYGFPMSTAMRDALTAGGEGYDPDSLVFRFLNNNDTGARFITVYGLNYYRTAMAMLLTLHGVPCLYTGDEVGAQFLPYETSGEIDWADPNDLRSFVKRLIAMRAEHPALHSRTWEPMTVEPARLLGYLRESEDGSDRVVVVLNFSATDIDATVPLPDGFADAGELVDLWTGERLPEPKGGTLAFPLAGWDFRVVKAVTS